MPKYFSVILILTLIIVATSVSAQTNFTTHKIEKGETLSALAKQYNTTVGAIMRLNGMHTNSKLVLGETIKIPSTQKTTTSVQKQTQTEKTIKQPVVTSSSTSATHTVAKGETLYSIAKKYHVYTKQLETWNHLSNGNIKPGQVLIVNNNAATVQQTSAPVVAKQRVETTTQTTTDTSLLKTPVKTTSVNVPQQKDAVVTNTPAQQSQSSDPIENATETKIEVAQQQQQTSTTTATAIAAKDEVSNADKKAVSGEGYFADSFKKNKNQQTMSGVSKIFKTTSGWSDGKYYILANDINPGTIVKLTAENGHSVYAKVLWNLGSMKENSGLNFRISDAAAAALNESASAFNLTVYY